MRERRENELRLKSHIIRNIKNSGRVGEARAKSHTTHNSIDLKMNQSTR